MAQDYHHGVRVVEVNEGTRSITTVSTATGEVQAVELVVRGRHKEVDSGEWKTGESSTTKVSSTNSYAKLTINGEVLYEVDLVNMVEIVDGVDLMEEHRNALGL